MFGLNGIEMDRNLLLEQRSQCVARGCVMSKSRCLVWPMCKGGRLG